MSSLGPPTMRPAAARYQPYPARRPAGTPALTLTPSLTPTPTLPGTGTGRPAGGPREPRASGLRVLTGRVGKVREWLGLGLPCPVLYRLHGSLAPGLKAAGDKGDVKLFEVCGEDGQRVRCRFQEIDRKMAAVQPGAALVVVGRPGRDGSLQVGGARDLIYVY